MQLPGYIREESDLAPAKAWACPHCGQVGRLNRHGALRGLAADGSAKTAVRGWRLFCSNRGRRRGCGRTVGVWLTTVMAGATVRTGQLWRFLGGRLAGRSVAAAWEAGGRGFSLEAAYGWWRRWQRGQPSLRTLLARGRDPPDGALEALITATYGADDPIAEFQARAQRAWP